MPKRAASLVSAALLLQAGPVHAADDPRVLAPVSDWTLDFADERCSLIREFADGDDTIRLQIDSFGPRPGYRVMLSGDLVPGSDAARMTELRVGYSADTRARERLTMFVGRFGDKNAVVFGRGFLPEGGSDDAGGSARAFERSVTHVTLDFKLRDPLRLDTGSMAAPFAAMERCVDDLLASWGIDPAVHRALARPPSMAVRTGPSERAFRTNEHGGERVFELIERAGETVAEPGRPGPADRRAQAFARNAYYSGNLVPVRVMIDASGQPTACVVQVANISEAFRRSACESLAGPYEPALDAAGQPVASFIQVELR